MKRAALAVTGVSDSILDLLDHLNAKATLFVVGSAIARHAGLAARVHEHGHEVGNHRFVTLTALVAGPGGGERARQLRARVEPGG